MRIPEITLRSLNVRGIGDKMKRKELFRWLRKKSFQIYFLQETHSTKETETLWRNEWGYEALLTNISSSKAGVGILFNNNFSYQLLKQYCDPEGRFIIVGIKSNDKTFTLINVYAPNKDDPEFLGKVIEYALSFACEDIFFGGDFNTVLDVEKNKKGGTNTNNHKQSEKNWRNYGKSGPNWYMERFTSAG